MIYEIMATQQGKYLTFVSTKRQVKETEEKQKKRIVHNILKRSLPLPV